MKRIALAVALLVSVAGPVWAGYAEGFAAIKRGDYGVALREIKPLAEQGHADAQVALGLMYFLRYGVPKDDAKAVKWYRRAAERGNARGQNFLGLSYHLGGGVPRDLAEAARWYRLAAEQGLSGAQSSLGRMYAKGLGLPQDYAQAHLWLDLAAMRGHDDARKRRERIAKEMTPAQIAEAQRLAGEWAPTPAQ